MKHTNDNAVSPVVGVILMIAVTIIMAAVMASVIFGNYGSQNAPHFVTVKPEHTGAGITLTLYKTDDLTRLDHLNVTINGADKGAWTPARIGESKLFAGNYSSRNNDVSVTAAYKDGTSLIVLATKT